MRTPLQKNEEILMKTFTSRVMMIVPALLVLAAIVIAGFIYHFYSSFFWSMIFVLPALLYFGWKYMEWRHNIWVVTNFRVIDEYGIININTRESPLDKINNVSYAQNLWGRLLGFGDVEIQTAATIGATVYYSVDKPKLLKDTITNAQANYKHVQMGLQVKDIMQQMQPTNNNPAPVNYVAPQPPKQVWADPKPINPQIASELEKLFAMKERGILNEVEYQRAKERLLGE